MKTMSTIHLDGCGGCQLEMLVKQKHIADLFSLLEFVPGHARTKADVGIVIGHFSMEELKRYRGIYDKIIISGACANESYLELLEIHDNAERDDDAMEMLLKDDLYRVKGCPVSLDELIYTIQCLKEGSSPKQINYPVCKECKEKENVCLLKEGKRCYGSLTAAGCGAKCPSMGVPCRGCRGWLPNAKKELLEKIFMKYEKNVWLESERVDAYEKSKDCNHSVRRKEQANGI